LIGTTREPTLHRVYGIYSILLDHLDKNEKKLKKKRKEWKVLIYEGLQAARSKLWEYYEKTETSDAGRLYGMAVLLGPVAKETFWKAAHWKEDPDWVQSYWLDLERLYDSTYAQRPLTKKRAVVPKDIRRRQEPSLDDVITQIYSDQSSSQFEERLDDADIEMMDYRQASKFMVVIMVVWLY
jgi:hypothetical protein